MRKCRQRIHYTEADMAELGLDLEILKQQFAQLDEESAEQPQIH